MLALKVSNFGLDRGYRQIGVNVSKGFFGLSGVWTLSNIKRVILVGMPTHEALWQAVFALGPLGTSAVHSDLSVVCLLNFYVQ